MENLHEPSFSSPCASNDTNITTATSFDISKRNPAAKFRLLRSRASRAGFSASRSFHGLEQFKIQQKVEEDEEENAEEEDETQEKAQGETTYITTRNVDDDDSIRSLECETDSSRVSTSCEEIQDNCSNLKTSPQWRGFFKLLRKRSNKTTMQWQGFHPLNVPLPKLTRRKSKRISDDMIPSLDVELCYFKSSWKNFTLSELEKATKNFSRENLIGEGGSSEVYKGQMEDGNFVAIKRLTGGTSEEMTSDFLSELGIIVHVNHHNIAKLIGYGVEGGMHLVLQLSPHGSLASLLNGSKEDLNWDVRYKIALGTAKGLLYLHEACQRRIIHKDIKAANILLTEDFEAQISSNSRCKRSLRSV